MEGGIVMDQKIEPRSFTWKDFTSEIARYYAARNCDFALEIGADGSCIFRFDVKPRGKKWFYKIIPDDTFPEWQDEALNELKEIFFPEDNATVKGIFQWPEVENSDVTLFVEPNSKDREYP